MAPFGFEGFEKRLELHFKGDNTMGLRRIEYPKLKQVLDAVQCSIVSSIGTQHFDSYVLSESSLFVYPKKVIIKTCGTTQLLKCIPCLISYALELNLELIKCRYTRGSFIFPTAQPFPHTSFTDEIIYLESNLPIHLCYRKARVFPSKLQSSSSHSWHVYTASIENSETGLQSKNCYTVEVCMTKLDRLVARGFYRQKGDRSSCDKAGRAMTVSTGIGYINPDAIICDYAFDPCGYSMNGMDGVRYSTIHVTPEDAYSYASYECVGSVDDCEDIGALMLKVMAVFRPGAVSVAITTSSSTAAEKMISSVSTVLKPRGLNYSSRCRLEDFPGSESVAFQTYSLCP